MEFVCKLLFNCALFCKHEVFEGAVDAVDEVELVLQEHEEFGGLAVDKGDLHCVDIG